MFKDKSDNKIFEVIYKEDNISGCKILVDKETGVHYLFSWTGYVGGITPLLDQNGKPIVSPINK